MRRQHRHPDGGFVIRRFEIKARTAGFNSLDNHQIGSRSAKHLGFPKRRRCSHPNSACLFESLVVFLAQPSERNTDDGNVLFQKHIKLRIKVRQFLDRVGLKSQIGGKVFQCRKHPALTINTFGRRRFGRRHAQIHSKTRIGTGKTATDEQANEVNHMIRALLGKLYGEDAAEATTIQYGGSMNAKNAAGLLVQPDIDGGLIGGASLKAPDFAAIVEAASK
mgnify:CR=1 FL=1